MDSVMLLANVIAAVGSRRSWVLASCRACSVVRTVWISRRLRDGENSIVRGPALRCDVLRWIFLVDAAGVLVERLLTN